MAAPPAELRVFTSSSCLDHRTPAGFPECPERLSTILSGVEGRRPVTRVEETEGPGGTLQSRADEWVERLHTRPYLERLQDAIARGMPIVDTGDNPLSAGSWGAIRGALEASLAALDWCSEGRGRRAFSAVRPPGHHAEADQAMGFCYLNHVALLAEGAIATELASRVAIVDFDVHHGNGTQHLFESRADVLYVSLHQWPFYPGTGAAEERGVGAGVGATLNVPLPAKTDSDGYAEAWRTLVLPALDDFAPELLLVSAGFDAWRLDPLGGMRVDEGGFEQWGRWLAEVAERHCEGRSVALLEGGYDLSSLPRLVEAFLRGFEAQ
jgi:acetoin utilization deacetylase AcuC-like enzyme